MNRVHWVLILLVILAVSTLFQMFTYSYFQKYDYDTIDYFITPSASLITGILLFFGMILPVFNGTKKLPNFKRILILGILGIIYSVAFILILHLFPILFYDDPSDYLKSVFGFFVADFHNVIKNYLFQMAILFAFEFIAKETQSITQQKNMEIELNQTKLQLLKNQLHPHFLFNAMNSVVSEIDSHPKNAQKMLIDISEILRTSLDSDFRDSVEINEEIELLKKYLSIEKIRYEEQLNYQIMIPEKYQNKRLPKLITQPLVENAIKHGFKGMKDSLSVIVEMTDDGEFLLIRNNGAKLPSNFLIGTGLHNVSERMKIFSEKDNSFEIVQEGNWVINKLRLK